MLIAFFGELRIKTEQTLSSLDVFLHSDDAQQRSPEIVAFEGHLRNEMVGEFADVVPTVAFTLPDEEVIAEEMKIMLDDGYKSEVAQKGHGLQRAVLLALLRVLARHGKRYQDRPAPIFLIGELESFLHPYAQKQLGEILNVLVDRYQVVTSTHSPFIITPVTIAGYRRVTKDVSRGSKATAPSTSSVDIDLLRRHLERRGNLEALFADRVILLEGRDDEQFFERVRQVFGLNFPEKKFTIFVRVGGKEELRQARKFYRQMGFDDVSTVGDLDNVFANDMRHTLNETGLDAGLVDRLREHIRWNERGDPSLEWVLQEISKRGEPSELVRMLSDLERHRIFILRHGSPERYYKNALGQKSGWSSLKSESDLLHPEYLKGILVELTK